MSFEISIIVKVLELCTNDKNSVTFAAEMKFQGPSVGRMVFIHVRRFDSYGLLKLQNVIFHFN
jgi:hypothetical protein